MGGSFMSSMNPLNRYASSQMMEWVTRCGSVMTTLKPKPAERLVQMKGFGGRGVGGGIDPEGQWRASE